jgi:hypothetical protein
MTTQVDELITLAEAMADAEADYREALRIDVGVQEASQAFLAARAALQAAIEEAVKVPQGWKLVPDSATHNMLNAANQGRKKGRSSSGDIYRAMLDAAPPALQQMEGER